jgi:hypothetical protein
MYSAIRLGRSVRASTQTMRTLRYFLRHNPEVQSRLDLIAHGSGDEDLADDLRKLAALVHTHRVLLVKAAEELGKAPQARLRALAAHDDERRRAVAQLAAVGRRDAAGALGVARQREGRGADQRRRQRGGGGGGVTRRCHGVELELELEAGAGKNALAAALTLRRARR